MRLVIALGIAAAALAEIVGARADHQPAFVVPGRPNIPVPINGYDASWGVVEGDWGLYRPGAPPGVTVIPSPYVPPLRPDRPVRYTPASPYFPSLGSKPSIGRLEIEPPANRPLPKPAEKFERSWSAESPDVPPTQYAPSSPMLISPEVNVNSPFPPEQGQNGQNGMKPVTPRRRR